MESNFFVSIKQKDENLYKSLQEEKNESHNERVASKAVTSRKSG